MVSGSVYVSAAQYGPQLTPIVRATGRLWPPRKKFRSHPLSHRHTVRQLGTRHIAAITLLTPKPSLVEPTTIISKLPILPRTSASLRNVPILLVTPAFVSWAQTHNTLLPSIMGHVFQNALQTDGNVADIFSISAVVDKLPLPAGYKSFQYPPWYEGSPAFEQEGCEGISLLVVDRDYLSGDIVRPMRRRDVSMPEVEPTITYAVTHKQSDGETGFIEVGIHTANTLFVTGKPRTMLASRWRFDENAGNLKMNETRDLAICCIKSLPESSFVTPLIPLHAITPPRKVITSMGNILSLISAEKGSTKTAPASAELEKSLPVYVEKNRLQNHKLAVWALVSSEELQSDTGLSSEERNDIGKISNAIGNGARLHRLMSGGGGWGKKQGLLSLDPEYSYQQEHGFGHRYPITELFEGGTEVERDIDEMPLGASTFLEFNNGKLKTPLSELTKPGDTVQFFVAPLDAGVLSDQRSMDNGCSLHSSKQAEEITEDYIFGVIPSADTASSTSEGLKSDLQSPDQTFDHNLIVLPNRFGALSEKGITYTKAKTNNLLSSKRPTGTLEVSGTKIDVPGARIVIRNQFE
ncbi:hypothetical protein PRK78_002257 [Emydomyces testavorans]|uniref:Uncharacterized protein n=1 Tax=Emydomyces testavorans TaxID=2070801 RepID=A0AAF0IHF8_9EURO|nr:hypothetical protein PRK78_002257 [Emydomyces testavorans]